MVYASCDIFDDDNKAIRLSNPARRVISLAPDLTEDLFAIGAGEHIVGVVQGSDYPAAVKKIPQVGAYTGIDLEKIISLHPDLIVTWGNTFSRPLLALKKFGIPIYVSKPQRLEDVPRTLLNLGCLTGRVKNAHQQAENFSQRLSLINRKFSGEKPVTVFYQIGSYSLITINKNSWINQVITLCGGRNIFAEARLIAPEVSWESVVTANPQVIIADATNENWKARWLKWQTIPAVKNNFLYSINPDLIERAGPRLLEGAEKICGDLQHAR